MRTSQHGERNNTGDDTRPAHCGKPQLLPLYRARLGVRIAGNVAARPEPLSKPTWGSSGCSGPLPARDGLAQSRWTRAAMARA
jgi:hypothetical protein